MGNTFDSLSDDEIRQVIALVETLEKSSFDFLQVEVGDLKVTIGKGHVPPTVGAAPNMTTASPVPLRSRRPLYPPRLQPSSPRRGHIVCAAAGGGRRRRAGDRRDRSSPAGTLLRAA